MKYKVVETSEVTEDSLEEILNHWTAEGWRYDGMQFVVKESARRAGLGGKVSPHTLRHTFATRLYEKTGDLHLVQRALGHRQITTTEIYARVGEGALRQAVRMI